MTVAADDSLKTYPGNGVSNSFNGPRLFDASHLSVLLVKDDDHTTTVPDFTLSLVGANGPSRVVLVNPATNPVGYTLQLRREVPIAQDANFTNQQTLLRRVVEATFDVLVMMIQQIKELAGRGLHVGPTVVGVNTQLPPPLAGAPLVWNFDQDGLENGSLTMTGDMLLRPNLAGDGGAGYVFYKQAGDGARRRDVLGKLSETPSVLDYIPPSEHAAIKAFTSTYDCTADINAALAANRNVKAEEGRYLITGPISPQRFGSLIGEGRLGMQLYITSAFNMAATGVVILPDGEPSAFLDNITFDFVQPNVASRALCNQYPPAIDASAAVRFELGSIRIQGAWDGINAIGNTGGAYAERLEIGALNKGMIIDGALDFFHIESFHFWPFGILGLTTLYNSVYSDGTTKALECGRCDGLNIGKLSTFRAMVDFTSNGTLIEGRHIASLQLDGDGSRLAHAAGSLQIGMLYSTKTSAPTNPSVLVAGGTVIIGNISSAVTTSASEVLVTGGGLHIGGGLINQNNVAHSAAEVTGGRLSINGVRMAIPPAAVRSKAYVNQTGGALVMGGCFTDVLAGGSGNAVAVAADNAGHLIAGNNFGGWGMSWPASMVLGCYGENAKGRIGFTPTLTFSTPGDWNPTYVFRSAWWVPTPAGYHFDIRMVVTANAYTTAAGTLQIAGLPIVHQGVDNIGFPVVATSKLNTTAGYTNVAAILAAGFGTMSLVESGDALARQNLGPAAIPAGTTSVELHVSGFVTT